MAPDTLWLFCCEGHGYFTPQYLACFLQVRTLIPSPNSFQVVLIELQSIHAQVGFPSVVSII